MSDQPPLEPTHDSDESADSGESGDATTGPDFSAPAGADPEHDDGGTDLARSIARGLAGRTPKPKKTYRGPQRPRSAGVGASGAHPDERDPKLIEDHIDRLVAEQGWGTDLRVHGVFARWGAIVGREVADHVTPESFTEGRLVVRTDSTAWATQMKLLAGQVVRRLNEELGDETVRIIDVLGPRTRSWAKGKWAVKGRGPRDTYG